MKRVIFEIAHYHTHSTVTAYLCDGARYLGALEILDGPDTVVDCLAEGRINRAKETFLALDSRFEFDPVQICDYRDRVKEEA